MSATVEVLRKVIDNEGNVLLVQPNPDNPEYLEITPHHNSRAWYGNFSISMPPELAEKLAYAISITAKEIKGST